MIELPMSCFMPTGEDFFASPRLRQELTEREEIAVWGQHLRWRQQLEPRCRFTPAGIANRHERLRRWTLFAMFRYVRFASRHPEIRSMFSLCAARVSLQHMADCAGTDAPAFYYEWFMQDQPKRLATWGRTVIERLAGSEEHVELLRSMRRWQVDRTIVGGVMGR